MRTQQESRAPICFQCGYPMRAGSSPGNVTYYYCTGRPGEQPCKRKQKTGRWVRRGKMVEKRNSD